MALFPLSLNHSALYQILNQSRVYYLIAISTSAYYKLDLWIRVVLLVEPLQVPDILGVQLLHVLLTGVGDLLRRDRCPHHQCDRLSGTQFMIIFETTPTKCFPLTCVGQFQNCTGRCLDLGRRPEQTQLLKSESPGCSSQRNPPCSPAVRTQAIKKISPSKNLQPCHRWRPPQRRRWGPRRRRTGAPA